MGDRDESPFPRRGGGSGMSHPFQGGVGVRDGSSFPRSGWGDHDESSNGGVSQGWGGGEPITAKGRGWGADYVNVPVKYQPYYFGDPRQSHHT